MGINNHSNLLVFGVVDAVGGGATVYPLPGNGSAAEAVAELKVPVARACTAKNLYVKMVTAPGGAVTDTITVRIGGVDTTLTCTVVGVATTGNDIDITHAFAVAAGNELSVKYVAGGASTAADVIVSFELEFLQ